jgi:hypothetical protein
MPGAWHKHDRNASPRPKHGPWRRRGWNQVRCFSCCGDRHLEFECGQTFVYLIGVFCAILAIHNATAVPWFALVTPATDAHPETGKPSYGMESAPNWHALVGYRGVKLWPDPALFLGPHAALLSILLMAYATWWVRYMLVRGMSKSVVGKRSSRPSDDAPETRSSASRRSDDEQHVAPAEISSAAVIQLHRERQVFGASFLLFAHAVPIVSAGRPGMPNLGTWRVWIGLCLSVVGGLSVYGDKGHVKYVCRPLGDIAFVIIQVVVLSEAIPEFFEVASGVVSWIGFSTFATDLEGTCEHMWCDRIDPDVGWIPQGGEAGNHPHPLSGHGPYSGFWWGAAVGPTICCVLLLWFGRVTQGVLFPKQPTREEQLRAVGNYHTVGGDHSASMSSIPGEGQIVRAAVRKTNADVALERLDFLVSRTPAAADVVWISAAIVPNMITAWYIFRVATEAEKSTTCLEEYQIPGFSGDAIGDKPIYNNPAAEAVELGWTGLIHALRLYGICQVINTVVLMFLGIGVFCELKSSCFLGVVGTVCMLVPNVVFIVSLSLSLLSIATSSLGYICFAFTF